MRLYFTQHARAEAKDVDPARPITEEGQAETTKVAAVLASAGLKVDEIWHSGKLRARQTAEILAETLSPPGGVIQREGLDPMDDPLPLVDAIRGGSSVVLVVGHLPFMSRLAGLLLSGDPEATPVAPRNSGVVAVEEDGDGWALSWYLVPELL